MIGRIAGITGLAPTDDPVTPEELLRTFDLAALPTTFPDLVQVQWDRPCSSDEGASDLDDRDGDNDDG